jgi:hypothetical protein
MRVSVALNAHPISGSSEAKELLPEAETGRSAPASFSGAYGILCLKKLKGAGIVLVAAKHNRRELAAELGADSHIESSRTALNYILMGPRSPAEIAQHARDLMQSAGVGKTRKLRKDAVVAIEVVFSLPIDSPIDTHEYFSDCIAWAASRFGGAENILSADVHLDEAAPHCHLLAVPLISGRMVGSDLLGGKGKFASIREDFYNAVASKHGLSGPAPRLRGNTLKAAVAAVLSTLRIRDDPVLLSAIWPVVREQVQRDPRPYAALLDIVVPGPAPKFLRTMAAIFTSPGQGPRREIRAW